MGVRKQGITTYYIDHKIESVSCNYCVPCLCGSLKHRRTCHRDCPLNPRYDD